MVFIDAEYVIQSLRSLKGLPLNARIHICNIYWHKLIKEANQGRSISGIFYYSAGLSEITDKGSFEKQKDYFGQLEKCIPNLVVRLGKMLKIRLKAAETWRETTENANKSNAYTWIQKGVDVRLAMDMILKAVKNEYDTAILVTNDYDFYETIQEVNELGKKVELITFEREDGGENVALHKIAEKHTCINYQMGRNRFWHEVYA